MEGSVRLFVSDDALTRCIGELRRAFEYNARDPSILQTVPKRGYMLAAPVTWNPDPPSAGSGNGAVPEISAQARQSLIRKRGRLAPGVFCTLLAAIALIAIFRSFRREPSAHASVHRLAVLPLMNLTGDSAQDYFAHGVTEQLITELAQIRSWEVISHTSVMRFKQTREPPGRSRASCPLIGITVYPTKSSEPGGQVVLRLPLLIGCFDCYFLVPAYRQYPLTCWSFLLPD